MKHYFRNLVVVSAAGVVAAVSFQMPSASADPRHCVSGRLCLYNNAYYLGTPSMPTIETRKCVDLAPSIDNKTEAIINRSKKFSFQVFAKKGCEPRYYLGHIYANSQGVMSGNANDNQLQVKDNISSFIRIG